MKLKIESNINLENELKDVKNNWRRIMERATKISLMINNKPVSLLKDRWCDDPKYIYEVNYIKTQINTIELLTDKERISQLEKEVAELKKEKKPKLPEYYIWDFSNVTDFFTGEEFHYRKPLAKEYPFYTIKEMNRNYVVAENTVTQRLYNVPINKLKHKEEYTNWKKHMDMLEENIRRSR